MDPEIAKEVAALPRLNFAQLRARYAELFHEPTRVGNRSWLVRRIAWRLQALAEGDLSDRARYYAAQHGVALSTRLSEGPRSRFGLQSFSPSLLILLRHPLDLLMDHLAKLRRLHDFAIRPPPGREMAVFGRFPEKLREPSSTYCAKCRAGRRPVTFKNPVFYRARRALGVCRSIARAWFEAILVAEFRRKVAVF